MKITFDIIAKIEGNLGELLAQTSPAPAVPTLAELLETMGQLAFVVETVAHLQGKEKELLPTADKARALIEKLQTINI